MAMTLRIGSVLCAAAVLVACRGAGNSEKTVPNPVAPGEIIMISLCGSTAEPRGPCPNFPDNSIQIRVGGAGGAQCPCFTFAIVNLNLTDLGPAGGTTYEFTGFRPGTFTVTGQFMTPGLYLTFVHNTSTSTIGIVPSSLQSLSGPAIGANSSCQIGYSVGSSGNPGRTPIPFSFQFTVAAAQNGGSC